MTRTLHPEFLRPKVESLKKNILSAIAQKAFINIHEHTLIFFRTFKFDPQHFYSPLSKAPISRLNLITCLLSLGNSCYN